MERFTLKGGIFLYALFDGEFARATRDIDLLAKNIPNNAEDMKRIFEDIFSVQCDDALRYDLNTLELDMKAPEIFAYSIISVIAEKFEAIVSLGDANSRYKDFYDIYILADQYDLDGVELKEAIRETFEHRGTDFDDIYAFTDGFTGSEIHQRRWKAFLKKKKALVNVELADVINLLRALLLPVVDSIKRNRDYSATWVHKSREWKV